MLEIYLLELKSDLELRPCRSLILAAGYLMEFYPRVCLPDWVDALAYPIHKNLNNWESLLDEVRREIAAEVQL